MTILKFFVDEIVEGMIDTNYNNNKYFTLDIIWWVYRSNDFYEDVVASRVGFVTLNYFISSRRTRITTLN